MAKKRPKPTLATGVSRKTYEEALQRIDDLERDVDHLLRKCSERREVAEKLRMHIKMSFEEVYKPGGVDSVKDRRKVSNRLLVNNGPIAKALLYLADPDTNIKPQW